MNEIELTNLATASFKYGIQTISAKEKRTRMNLRSQHFIDYQTALYSFDSYKVKIATLIYNIYNRIKLHPLPYCTSGNALDRNKMER